jgi:hypothetical protein
LFAIFSLVFIQIDGRDMHEFLDLLGEDFIESGVAVSYIDSGNSCNHINVLFTFVIIEILHVSSHGKERFFVIGFVEGKKVLVMEVEGLLRGDACVWLRLVGGEVGVTNGFGNIVADFLHGFALLFCIYFMILQSINSKISNKFC